MDMTHNTNDTVKVHHCKNSGCFNLYGWL